MLGIIDRLRRKRRRRREVCKTHFFVSFPSSLLCGFIWSGLVWSGLVTVFSLWVSASHGWLVMGSA